MNLRYLPRLRSARPSSAPRFSSGPLKLSDRMQSLDSKGLIAPNAFCIAICTVTGANLMSLSAVPPVLLLSPGALPSRYQVTPRLALVVITDEQRSLTIIQLLVEAVAP